MHLCSIHLPIPSYLPSVLAIPLPRQNIIMEAVVWPSESHGIPFSLYLQVFIAVSHWSGSMPLASAIPSYWALTGTPLGHPAVSLCHGDPAALDL